MYASSPRCRIPYPGILLLLVAAAAALPAWSAGTPTGEDMIIFTANQSWYSRVYLLDMDGSVYNYFEYEFFRLVDLEVVDNEVYIAEAFAPRLEKFDMNTGALDVIIDDWSLYYFYDVAFDGTYFYVNEWDLNRYDINGDKDGVASFDGDVWGGAWDGDYYWTLGEDGQMKCWDLKDWPAVTELSENAMAAPSTHCRGLYFDGEYFWTAESIESTLGQIFRFDQDGSVVQQWTAPAYQGWGACLVRGNRPPDMPELPDPANGAEDVPVSALLSWQSIDPDGDTVVFDVYLGTASPLPLVSSQQAEASYSPPGGLEEGQDYMWQIVAFDNHGDSTTGPVWSFTSEISFVCGDVDGSGAGPDIADLVYLVSYMFQEGPVPPVLEACDVNGDGMGPDIADLVYLVSYMFQEGPALQCE